MNMLIGPIILVFALSCCKLTSANAPLPVPSVVTYPLVTYHEQRKRRRHLLNVEDEEDSLQTTTIDSRASRRRSEAQQVGALFQGYGTHYVDIWCGTPPQRQTVIVDTGSGVTAFPCSKCRDCGVPKYHIDSLFKEGASSTYRLNSCTNGCVASRSRCSSDKCTISMSYAEGSRWDAVESIDTCYIGGPHEMATVDDGSSEDLDPRHVSAFDLVFGCQTLVTRLFVTQLADGIMGMDSRAESFWSQMFKAGKMGSAKQFSLCFSRSPNVERKGSEAGAVTLGGTDKRFHKTPMVFSSGADGGRAGFFSVRVRRIYLRRGTAGESVLSSLANPNKDIKALDLPEDTLNVGGIIVDSGTTDTYWNRGIAEAFNEVFKEMSGGRHHNNNDISLTHDEMMALPTILFQLVSSKEVNAGMDAYKTPGLVGSLDESHPFDVLLAFPPSHYMEYDPETGMYASRFYTTEGGGSVLGANSMMGHDILFDSDNHRIGWAESDCDYTKLVTENGFAFPITGNLQPGNTEEASSNTSVESPKVTPIHALTEAPVGGYSVTREPQTNPTMVKFLDWFEECTHTECADRLPIYLVFFGLLCTFLSCSLCYCLCCCFCRCRRARKIDEYPGTHDLELKTFRDDPTNSPYKDEDNDDQDAETEDDKSDAQEFDGDYA